MALYPAPRPARCRSLVSTIQQLCVSFERSLRAANKSPRTLETYLSAVQLFDGYLTAHHLPQRATQITRGHVEAFLADQLKHWKPATAHNRHEGLQRFFRWCQEEGEIPFSPMVGMRPPAVPENPPLVLSEGQLRKLLKVCEGRDFRAKRDTAIIRLFLDTGMRVGELAALQTGDNTLSKERPA